MFLVAKGAAVVERLDAASSVLMVFYCRRAAMSLPNCVFCHNFYMTFFNIVSKYQYPVLLHIQFFLVCPLPLYLSP
jgi:hypothetical protein